MGDERKFYVESNPIHRAPALLRFATVAFSAAGLALFITSASLHGRSFWLAFGGGVGCLGAFFLLAAETRRRGLRRMALTESDVLARREEVEAELKKPTRRAALLPIVLGLVFFVPAVIGLPFAIVGVLPGFRPPPSVMLEEAVPGRWVRLERADLDCASRFPLRESVYFLGRSEGGGAFVASFSRPVSCDEARRELVGVVEDLHPNLARTLRGWLPDRAGVRSLCTWCGPENSRWGLLLAVLGLVAGGLLLRAGLREYQQAQPRSG